MAEIFSDMEGFGLDADDDLIPRHGEPRHPKPYRTLDEIRQERHRSFRHFLEMNTPDRHPEWDGNPDHFKLNVTNDHDGQRRLARWNEAMEKLGSRDTLKKFVISLLLHRTKKMVMIMSVLSDENYRKRFSRVTKTLNLPYIWGDV